MRDTLGRRRVPRAGSLLACLAALAISGCATPQALPSQAVKQRWASFLQNGRTTKEDVLLRLGPPAAQLQSEHIRTYRLAVDASLGLVVLSRRLQPSDPRLARWSREGYSLVLVFDGQSVLQRHSLIQVGPSHEPNVIILFPGLLI